MITVRDLSKKYNQTKVLNNINFTISKGDIVGIIGPNGAGKSTLVSIIAKIIKATSGNVTISEGKTAYVPQEITLFLNLSVKENLRFWDTISNSHSIKKRSKNIDQIAEIASISDSLHKKVEELSGGLKRRVNIAAALLSKPDILIMDEPTVGMDIISRAEMLDFIKQLSLDGTTIIYVSHHPDEIEKLCNHIICLNQGNLVFDGSLEELKALYPPNTSIHDVVLNISSSSKISNKEREANEAYKHNSL